MRLGIHFDLGSEDEQLANTVISHSLTWDVGKELSMVAIWYLDKCIYLCGLPQWLISKQFTCNVEDTGLIPGSGRSPGDLGEGNGNLLQYACQGNPMDRGAWWATIHGVEKSQTLLSDQRTAISICGVGMMSFL